MGIFNFLYSYLSEGYSVTTMILSASSSLALAAAIVIGFHLGRRNHAMVALLTWFVLMAAAAVSASGWDRVASKLVAVHIWKIILMGGVIYGIFWLITRLIDYATRSQRGGNY